MKKSILLLATTLSLSMNMITASAEETEGLDYGISGSLDPYMYQEIGDDDNCPGKDELQNQEHLISSGWNIIRYSSTPIADNTSVERLIRPYRIGLDITNADSSFNTGLDIADVTCKYGNGTVLKRTYRENQSPHPRATDIGASAYSPGDTFDSIAKNCTTTVGNLRECGWRYFHRHLAILSNKYPIRGGCG